MSNSSPLFRLVKTVTLSRAGKHPVPLDRHSLQIPCRVKIAGTGDREGVNVVGMDKIGVCVPKKGQVNGATRRILAKVFDVPKSSVAVIQGRRSDDKILSVNGLEIDPGSEENFLRQARKSLEEAIYKD